MWLSCLIWQPCRPSWRVISPPPMLPKDTELRGEYDGIDSPKDMGEGAIFPTERPNGSLYSGGSARARGTRRGRSPWCCAPLLVIGGDFNRRHQRMCQWGRRSRRPRGCLRILGHQRHLVVGRRALEPARAVVLRQFVGLPHFCTIPTPSYTSSPPYMLHVTYFCSSRNTHTPALVASWGFTDATSPSGSVMIKSKSKSKYIVEEEIIQLNHQPREWDNFYGCVTLVNVF